MFPIDSVDVMDLEEVKVCLRAVLSSTPLSYCLSSLLVDFKNSTGVNLPLFGHHTPVEFLRSLADTVQLLGNPYNPEVALVESKKSAHIISLVERQKGNGKAKVKNPNLTHKQRQIIPSGIVPLSHGSSKSQNPGSDSFPFTQLESRSGNGSLLTSKDSSNLLCTASKKSDTRTTLELPQSKLYASVLPQPKPVKPPPLNFPNPPPPITHASSNQKVSITPSGNEPNNVHIKKAPLESFACKKSDSCYFEDVSDSESCPSTDDLTDCLGQPVPPSCDSINSAIKSKLRKLIKSYPEGLWCCDLPKLFFEEYHFVLDYREFGYTSLIQMLSELPDVFRCVRPGNEDWILFDASIPPSSEEKKVMDLQRRGNMKAEVRGNLQRLLHKYSEDFSAVGVRMDKIPELYQEMFGTAIDFQSLGFKDLKSLLETWEGSILYIVSIGGKLYCGPTFNTIGHSPARWADALPPITAENDIFVEIFPKDVVGPEEGLLELDLARHIAVGHVVEVCVAEVWSPSKFFLQLNKFRTRLNRLMDDLQKFYGIFVNKYKMPESTIRANQICVGLYNADPEFPDEWHRAQILKIINEKTVLINFVDYGTVTRVKKSHLRFLHRSFQSFPIQAIRAQLSGVAPPNGEETWPITTSKKFLDLLRVPYLNAEMVDIDFKSPSLSVALFDPFQESRLSINRKLVQDKLARMEEEVKEVVPLGKVVDDCRKNLAPEGTEKKSCALRIPSAPNEQDKKSGNENVVHELDENEDWKRFAKEEFRVTLQQPNSPPDSAHIEQLPTNTAPPPPLEKAQLRRPDPLPVPENGKLLTSLPQPDKPASQQVSRPPPGLQQVHPLPDLDQIPFLVPPEDIRKKINLLAIELLAKNNSIKEVGIIDPALALKIATELAEAYITSHLSFNAPTLPYGLSSPHRPPHCLQPSPEAPDAPHVPPSREPPPVHPSPDDIPPKDSALPPSSGSGNRSETNQELVREYIEEAEIGGKRVHPVKVENELYLCAEEVIREFTMLTSREIADTVLRLKKMVAEYRVISKKSDEKVFQALKSCDLPGLAKKSKKLKMYLLPVGKVAEYLRALGCLTSSFENDLVELQKNWEKRRNQKTELS